MTRGLRIGHVSRDASLRNPADKAHDPREIGGMAHTLLIVEDDAATAAYLAKRLNEQGFVTDHAANGRDGLFWRPTAATTR